MSRRLLLAVTLAAAACGDSALSPPPGPPGPPPPPPPPPSPVASSLVVHAGDGQEGLPGRAVGIRPAVRVLDQRGQPFPSLEVRFGVDTGGGSVGTASVVTGPDGVATVDRWVLGRTEGVNRLRVSGGTLPPVVLTATARFPRGTNPTVDHVVRVALPDGSPWRLTDLEVASTLGHVPLDANGGAAVPFFAGGPQLATVLSPTGDPLLMGWVDGTARTLSARSTAEVLAYFDLRAYQLPSPVVRREAHRQIGAMTNELAGLEQAIAAALRAPVGPAPLATAGVDAARLGLRTVVLAAPRRAPIQTGSRIEPADLQSGLAVNDVGYHQFRIANWYRRRAVAFLDRVAFVPASGGAEVADTVRGGPIRVGASGGLTTVTGGLADIVTGSEAWEPAEVGPIGTPLVPADARVTRYRLTILGPGGLQGPAFKDLTPLQRRALDQVAFESIMLETVIPLLGTAIDGMNEVNKYAGDPEVLEAVTGFIDHFPRDALDKAINGDVAGAAGALFKLLVESEDVQEYFVHLVEVVSAKYLGGIFHPDLSFHVRDRAIRLLARIDVLLGASDVLLQIGQLSSADKVSTWDIRINRSRVKIEEGNVKLNLGDVQLFHGVVLDATGGGPGPRFEYRWRTTGTVGKINAPSGPPVTEIPLPGSDVINYTAGFNDYGTDRLILEAFQRTATGLEPIGADTVTVEVVRGQVLLTPRLSSLRSGERQTLTVRVDDGRLIGGVLSYRWSTTGRFGLLAGGENGFETTSSSVEYTARSGVDGSDVVAVEVFSTASTVRTSLGRATATIKVEKKKTVFAGSWTFEPVSYTAVTGHARVCLKVVGTFPLVEGATMYTVTQYGGGPNSAATFQLPPPTQTYLPCNPGWGRNGVQGANYRYLLAGLDGPADAVASGKAQYEARFGGMLIEVKVEY